MGVLLIRVQGVWSQKKQPSLFLDHQSLSTFMIIKRQFSNVSLFLHRSGDKVQHFKIFKDDDKKYHLWIRKFPSLNQLVEYHKTNSVSKTQHILLNEVDFTVSNQLLNPLISIKCNVHSEL